MSGYTSQSQYWHDNYTEIESDPNGLFHVYRGPDGQIYIDWTPTDAPSWSSRGQWSDDFSALTGHMPQSWQDAIDHIANTYGPESSTVHHIGYSRGGAFAEMFGGTGYGAMTNPAMPVAAGAHDQAPNEPTHWWDPLDMVHNLLHASHGHFDPFTPNPSQAGIPDQTPTTPVGPLMPPANVIEMFGHDDNGHSLIAAHPAMPFGSSSYAGSLSGRSRFRSSYPANQTRRQTEQFGDLNAYNRVYQFYNYHGEKKQMLEEYCRGLVLSLVRIQKGVVHDYEDPIAWPYPVHQPEAQITGIEPQDSTLDAYLNWIEFHFKDARRDGGFYGKTLGNRVGTEGDVSDEEPLAEQYQYDIAINKKTCVQLWETFNPNPDDPALPQTGRRMKSLAKLAQDITEVFESLAYLDTNFQRAHDAADPDMGTPHIDTLDIRPTRVMLIKSLKSGGKITHDVIYDDEQFASSRVDIGSYTTVTIHNVSPASGDIAVAQDPMAADTITHVPLVGKMYTFSGSCPKVWDKHKADLHQLFNPLYFRTGRYRLPHSKIHDLDQFKSPPRGRAIWSNCIGESRIAIGPGQIKKLRMNFRIRDSLGEFWQKYRDHYLSDSRLGRTVCICLEPMIRRQHVGEPKSIALMKPMDAVDPGHYQFQSSLNAYGWDDGIVPPGPLSAVVEYQPYELRQTVDNHGVVSMRKHLRYAFKLSTAEANTPNFMLSTDPAAAGSGVYVPSPPFKSGAIRYYFYDFTDQTKRLVAGRAVHPTVIVQEGGVVNSVCEPDPSELTTPSIAPTSHWVPALWTDDKNRVAKGDPMMFNIQINRLLHAKTKLKKFHALGADKTGIKRKWEDRLISNLGVDLFGNPVSTDPDDAPRDIDMFNAAGIRAVIAEGDTGNISVAAAPALNVTVQGSAGLTQEQTQAAMEAALLSAHPLANAVHEAGHPDAGKLKLDHHPLAGIITANGKLAVDAGALTLASGQTVGVTGTVGLTPGTTVPVSVGNVSVPVSVGNASVPVNTSGASVPVSVGNASVPVNTSGASVPVSVGYATVPVNTYGASVPVSHSNLPTVQVAAGQTVGVHGEVGLSADAVAKIDGGIHLATDAAGVPVDANGNAVKVYVSHDNLPTVDIAPGQTVELAEGGQVDVRLVGYGSTDVRVDPTTGKKQWLYSNGQWYNFVEDSAIVRYGDKAVRIDATTGKRQWQYSDGNWYDEMLQVSNYQYPVRINPVDGKKQWQYSDGNWYNFFDNVIINGTTGILPVAEQNADSWANTSLLGMFT